MKIEIVDHMIHVNGKRVPFKQTPNGGRALKLKGQVFHHTSSGLSPGGDISWLTQRRAKASAHTVIAHDGSITQLQALNKTTWHAGKSRYKGVPNQNSYTIGHEIDNPGHLQKLGNGKFKGIGGIYEPNQVVEMRSSQHGNARYWLEFSDAQLETCFALAKAIDDHYNLSYVTTHYEISPGRKIDPGPHFPIGQLKSMLNGRADTQRAAVKRPTVMDKIRTVVPVAKKFKTDDDIDGYVDVRSMLNMRQWPSGSSKRVARLANNTPFQIVRSGTFDHDGSDAIWHLIKTERHEGWVHSDYTRLV